MPEIEVKTEKQKHYWGQVAGFDIIVKSGGFVVIMAEGKELVKHHIPFYDRETIKPIELRHTNTPNIIQITTEKRVGRDPKTNIPFEHTFGYCLNLQDTLMSEWGWWW